MQKGLGQVWLLLMAAAVSSHGAFDSLCWRGDLSHVMWLGASFSDWLPDCVCSFCGHSRMRQWYASALTLHFLHRYGGEVGRESLGSFHWGLWARGC